MAAIKELGQGAQKLSHPLRMADGNAAAGVAAVDSRFEAGRQVIDMADAAVTLVLGESATGEVRWVSNHLYVDPNSAGANEDLTMPAPADWRGPCSIINTGDEDIIVKNSGGIVVGTIGPRGLGIVTSSGTDTFMQVAPRGEAAVQRATGSIAAAATRTLSTTPVTLVAAPGAGFYLEFVSIHLWLDFSGGAHTGSATTTVNLGSNAQSTTIAAGAITASADAHTVATPADNLTLTANTALTLEASADYTGSSSTSVLKYSILYRIRPLEFTV